MSVADLTQIFVPEDSERRSKLTSGGKLVHYTTAEAGYSIIVGKEVWLRNALLMNDFSEIQYGLACLQTAWASPAGVELQTWLDERLPGFKDEIVATFDAHADGLKVATFMISLSEHSDHEDELGRLSMWRAYGGKNGVALVLDPEIFISETDELKAFSAPVSYLSVPEFVANFEKFVRRVTEAEDQLRREEKGNLLSAFFYTFRLYVLCTKHPGFQEEREWRVFHSPLIEGSSDWLRKDREIINGVPQEIVKLSLQSNPDRGVNGLSPSELLRRVIIGPSAYPVPTYHALYGAMTSVGIDNPNERLWMSEIPLRQ